MRMVKKHNNNPKKVKEVIEFVLQSSGIEYATQKMNEFRDKALKILDGFPASESKESLISLVNYSINRKK